MQITFGDDNERSRCNTGVQQCWLKLEQTAFSFSIQAGGWEKAAELRSITPHL